MSHLPDSSRDTLAWVAELLREGFTGRLEIEVFQGGVRSIRPTPALEPKDLKDRPLLRTG